MNVSPYSWDKLLTVGGAAAAAMMVVQAVKNPLDKIVKIPTRWLVFFVSFIILLLAHLFTTGVTWSDIPLLLINALIAMFTAMGGYEATFATADRAKEARMTSQARHNEKHEQFIKK